MLLAPSPRFQFFDPGVLTDGELELVAPSPALAEEFLRTCEHPLSRAEPGSTISPEQLSDFLKSAPNGKQPPQGARGKVPAYHFWMRRAGGAAAEELTILGTINLRVGESSDLALYLGHIGYHVYPPARGRHYAERACRLLFPLARAHGLQAIWITCNPDNVASRRTCERLGAELIGIVPLPVNHVLYQRGERSKCRYRIDL